MMDSKGRRRFVVLCEELPPQSGGVAQFTHDICSYLHQTGQLLAAISLNPPTGVDLGFPYESIPLPDRRSGRRLGDSFWPTRKLTSALVRLQTEWSYRVAARLRRRLAELKKQNDPMVVWDTYTVHHPQVVPRVLEPEGHRYWLLFHGLDLIGAQAGGEAISAVCQTADRVVFNSEATKQLYRDLGFVPAAKESICYPGIDVAKAREAIDAQRGRNLFPQLPPHRFLVVSMCRLVKRKGIDLALRAMQLFGKSHPDACYAIAGTGSELPALKRLCTSLGLDGNVLFAGHISHDEKYNLLAQADAFVMPNRSLGGRDFEGFGISFLEAGIAGAVAIGGRHGGACEAIEDGVTGFSVDTESDEVAVGQIVQHLERLYADPALRLAMGQAAADRVAREFDIGLILENLTATA